MIIGHALIKRNKARIRKAIIIVLVSLLFGFRGINFGSRDIVGWAILGLLVFYLVTVVRVGWDWRIEYS